MRKKDAWIYAAMALVSVATVVDGQATNTFPSGGNVGIGTTSPQSALDIEGGGYLKVGSFFGVGPEGAGSVLYDPTGNYMRFSVGSSQVLWLSSTGNVGIGTTTPGTLFSVNTSSSNAVEALATVVAQGPIPVGGLGSGLRLGWESDTTGPTMRVVHGGDYNHAGIGFSVWQNAAEAEAMRITNAGYVGIGTASPGSKLEVNGNLRLTSGSGASITFADGTVQSTAYTGVTCGGDYADSVNVAGGRKHYEPGDVLVLTSDGNGDVAKSTEAYSTLVAGIYSTRPGTIGRRQTTDPKTAANEIPMAMVGIVPTKVSAENGPIRRGDLLVTASREGYAMKGTDHSRMLGAVVGKAMGSLDSGTGVIEVLVTLQ